MKIFKLIISLLVFTLPLQSIIINPQQALAEKTPRNLRSRRKLKTRQLYCHQSHQTFNLVYTALLIFLVLSDNPKWAIALFSIPLVLRLIESSFMHHESRKLFNYKNGKKKMRKFMRNLNNDSEMDFEQEKMKVMKYLKKNKLLKKRGKGLSEKKLIGIVSGYFKNVHGMKGAKMNQQIVSVMDKLFKNKSGIMEIIRGFM